MSKTIVVEVNGVTLHVVCDSAKMTAVLDSLEKQFEGQYIKMYTIDEVVTKEEFESDIASARSFIAQLEAGTLDVATSVEQVRKKRNGKFWSKSGYDILQLSNISDYFTDFTNAWSVFVFRLDVVNETTCELSLRSRTYTY